MFHVVNILHFPSEQIAVVAVVASVTCSSMQHVYTLEDGPVLNPDLARWVYGDSGGRARHRAQRWVSDNESVEKFEYASACFFRWLALNTTAGLVTLSAP